MTVFPEKKVTGEDNVKLMDFGYRRNLRYEQPGKQLP